MRLEMRLEMKGLYLIAYTSLGFVLLLQIIGPARVIADELQLKSCTNDTAADCPPNSSCSQVDEDFKCTCLGDLKLNPAWNLFQFGNFSVAAYCFNATNTRNTTNNKQSLIVYIRSPARKEHLAFGILLVLLAAVLAVGVLYVIKILKPLKHTKNAYIQLKRRRQNRQPLEEECYDIPMTRRNTNAQLLQL